MGEIIWLASYPKSGNTWTRAFLSYYQAEDESEFDINDLARSPISSNRLHFDQSVGIEAAALLPDEIDALRPAVFRHIVSERTQPLFMKTHEAWRDTVAGEPLFPADVTRGVVYIVRNPLDVVVSAAHHSGRTLDATVESLNDTAHTLAHTPHTANEQLEQWVGTWSEHVQSWLDNSGLPCYLMRYEDMLADPHAAFGKLIRFAGLDYDEARLDAAVTATSFSALREQERIKGFRERPLANPDFFFRAGRSGGWREVLAPELVASVLAAHGPTMQRLGYMDDQTQLFLERENEIHS